MKKSIIFCLCSVLLLSGCYDAQSGAMTGGYTGLIFGSAIGGIMDGPRGHDIGTLVGGLGGAVVGAAIGDANNRSVTDNYSSDNYQDAYRQRSGSNTVVNTPSYNNADDASASSSNNTYTPGDDRINMYNDDAYTGNYSAVSPHGFSLDTVGVKSTPGSSFKLNPAIDAGEESKIIFEVMNRSNTVLYDVQPTVLESTGNKHVFISPSIHVESIEPGKGIRYTAMVKADKHLKDGNVRFQVTVLQGNNKISSAINEIEVETLGRH